MKTKNLIYLIAIFVAAFTVALYIPKVVAYAQDKAEQRKINQQILDLELELEDVKWERQIMEDTKQEYYLHINWLNEEQKMLHKRADEIRKAIDELKWVNSLNDEIVNCYQWTWDLYNDCLDAIIYVQTGGL